MSRTRGGLAVHGSFAASIEIINVYVIHFVYCNIDVDALFDSM